MKSFNCWLTEFADYGMDLTPKEEKIKDEGDDPLHPINLEYVINYFNKKILGNKNARSRFAGEIQWGEDTGAIKLMFSPLGGTRASLRRLTCDLKGMPVWICERVIKVKNLFDDNPDNLTFKLEEVLLEMDQQEIKGPIRDYDELERLTLNLAGVLRSRSTQKIFMYEGIRRLIENEKYIIHFGCPGYGRQKAQKRLDQFAIFSEYDKKTGIIKIAANELGDNIAQYRFIYSPSTFLEYFSPSQKEDEIIEAILTCFNCY